MVDGWKACPECCQIFDYDRLVLIHFMSKHPLRYIAVRDRGFDALSEILPASIGSRIEEKMKKEKDEAVRDTSKAEKCMHALNEI